MAKYCIVATRQNVTRTPGWLNTLHTDHEPHSCELLPNSVSDNSLLPMGIRRKMAHETSQCPFASGPAPIVWTSIDRWTQFRDTEADQSAAPLADSVWHKEGLLVGPPAVVIHP